jgi:CRP-like cAMP-binding protein
MKSIEEIIREHRFFAGMDPAHLAFIAGCASNVAFDAGETIFRSGELANYFYIIRLGVVAIEAHDLRRGVIPIQTLQEHDVLGWSWLFPPYRWNFDARAVVLVRATAFDGKCLREKCNTDHDLGYELIQRFAGIMVKRLQSTRMQVMDVYH